MSPLETLKDNPFYILNASPQDTAAVLHSQMTRAALLSSSEAAEEALTLLLHPQKRLEAELSWFPATKKEQVSHLLSYLEDPSLRPFPEFETDSMLSRLNASRLLLTFWPDSFPHGLAGICLTVAVLLENINAEDTRNEINADRKASGFPLLQDPSVLSSSLQERIDLTLRELSLRIRNMKPDTAARAMDLLVNAYTGADPDYHINYYIDRILQSFLTAFADERQKRADAVRRLLTPSSVIPLAGLQNAILSWNRMAEPGRRLQEAKGLTDQESTALCLELLKYMYASMPSNRPVVNALASFLLPIFNTAPEGWRELLKKLVRF